MKTMNAGNRDKKKVCFFTIADEKNMDYARKMANSFKHFHPDIPLEIISGEVLDGALKRDPMFFYRATPIIASQLIKDYEVVVKIDADSVVTGPLNEAWMGDFDVKVVLNSNPREFKKYPVSIWDIHPIQEYLNCGFISMKSEKFINHWHKICYSNHFDNYQMKEQDLMNIIIHYGDYKVEMLDNGDSFYGLASKGYWPQVELRDNKLILPANQEWNKIDKYIKVIHIAGGNTPNKFNFNIQFKDGVARHLNKLVTEGIILKKSEK